MKQSRFGLLNRLNTKCKFNSIMIKTQFTKISLSKVDPSVELEKQLTSIECDLVEEQYSENGDFIRAIEKRIKLRNQWAHPDLLRLFNNLRPHLALVCEIAHDTPDIDDPEAELDVNSISPGIFAKSVIMNGSNEHIRVSILGFKTLAFDNTLDLRTPAIPLDGDYPFVAQLTDLLADIESEARKAIYEQKGCAQQLDLFADNEQEPGQSKKNQKAKRRNLADDLADSLGSDVTVTAINRPGENVSN